MRKLKLQVQMTIDGYIAGPNSEMDWVIWNWDNEIKDYVKSITEPVDCIVLGRKLAEGFIPYWANAAKEKENPIEGAEKLNVTPKIVFSKTINTADWENARLENGDLVEEINKLKASVGADIIAYGGAGFVSSLIEHNLVDEYHLFVNPCAIVKGMSIFNHRTNLKLVDVKSFDCGIAVLKYVKG